MAWTAAQVVTPQGAYLAKFIDSMNVSNHWEASQHVAWFSGLPNNANASAGVATHCSAFAASVAERLGVYLLRPPQHSQILLANAQTAWVNSSAGQTLGWTVLPGPLQAQALANQGFLVLFLRRNADPHKPGQYFNPGSYIGV